MNYVQGSVKLIQRNSQPGLTQPAPIAISGIPANAQIIKAYLWWDISGTLSQMTCTLTNPNNQTFNYPVTDIGFGPDKCWSYGGTRSFRAEVTNAVTGNGTYTISGLPSDPSGPPVTDDTDGATLLVIYRDLTASYQGRISIYDGSVVLLGGSSTQTMNWLNVCANSLTGKAFMVVGDLQLNGATMSFNGGPPVNIVWDWWNFIEQSVSVTSGQGSATFTFGSTGDCLNLVAMGLYYQTSGCPMCINETGTGEWFVQNSSLYVFPNPAQDRFLISISGINLPNALLEVTDVTGRTVYAERISLIKGSLNREIDMRAVPGGIYFLRLSGGDRFFSAKLVKQ
jgi:hypothetical protein